MYFAVPMLCVVVVGKFLMDLNSKDKLCLRAKSVYWVCHRNVGVGLYGIKRSLVVRYLTGRC